MRVLMITSEWPTLENPHAVPFIVRQVDFLRRAGVDVDVFHFRGRKNLFNYLSAWFQVQRRLLTGKYDLIHAQWGQSAFAAFPKRIPLITTFRGSDLEGIIGENGKYSLNGYLLSLFSRFAVVFSDEVVVVSAHLIHKFPFRRKYHVIPSGLDLTLFRPMAQTEAKEILGWSDDGRKIILFGGNPSVARKRYDLALQAVQLLVLDFPDVKLIPIQNVDHRQMMNYMNASDVLLLVSRHEGSPNVVKEALACNVPVVSTNVGDVAERIGNVAGCVLCEDDRPETIARALAQVLDANCRVDGRASVGMLDENLLCEQMISVYQQALANCSTSLES